MPPSGDPLRPFLRANLKRFKSAVVVVTLVVGVAIGARADGPGTETKVRTGIARTAQGICPLLVGQAIADVSAFTLSGERVNVRALVAEQPTVLVFFRGGWCPYCNLQLAQLRLIQTALREIGFQTIAISPDDPSSLRAAVARHQLDYTLLSDPESQVIAAFGLAYRAAPNDIGDATVQSSAAEATGRLPRLLPVPAVYVLSPHGRVVYQYANVDFRVRMSAEVLLTAARSYAPEH